MTELSVSVEKGADGPGTVIRLSGEADVTTAQALADALSSEEAKKPPLLLVDVSGLEFIDSAALQAIVGTHRKLHADGCRLALVSPTLALTRVLQLSGLDQVMAVYASAAQAAGQP